MKAAAQFRHRLAWCITMLALTAVPCFAQTTAMYLPLARNRITRGQAVLNFISNRQATVAPSPPRYQSRPERG